jgi:hypothetical protein
MNPYQQFVAESARLVREAKSYPLGHFDPMVRRGSARCAEGSFLRSASG